MSCDDTSPVPGGGPADATQSPLEQPTRRGFLSAVGAAAAVAAVGTGLGTDRPATANSTSGPTDAHCVIPPDNARLMTALNIRVGVARADLTQPAPAHPTNGDEKRYPDYVGNFSKTLPHNALYLVDPDAYEDLLAAVRAHTFAAFEKVPAGGPQQLVNPLGGYAYDLEGKDSSQFVLGPPPSVASDETASEAVEDYWMALLRDVSFEDYGKDPGVAAAAEELSDIKAFRGPRINGKVTPATLFRESAPGTLVGPFISQFLLQNFNQGAVPVIHKIQPSVPDRNFLTDYPTFLAVQNGALPGTDVEGGNPEVNPAGTPRYIRDGRDLARYVHVDYPYQAAWEAASILLTLNAPLSPTNPYLKSKRQIGFVTFNIVHYLSVAAEVIFRAMKAAWYQKWYVHRRLRPEEYGGLVQNVLTDKADYPLSDVILNSEAVGQVHSKYGTYLLPQAYPEGCPAHPAYPSGHATWIGASVTILKAFFDENWVIPNPVVPNSDGSALVPYKGDKLTVGGELNKLAGNFDSGRDFAGVHWRSDGHDGNRLGEAMAVSILRQQNPTLLEPHVFRFTSFDGKVITI